MNSIRSKVEAEHKRRRAAFEQAAGPHGALLKQYADLSADARKANEIANAKRQAVAEFTAKPEYIEAQKVAGAARVPLSQIEQAMPYIGLFDVLSEYGLTQVPAEALTAFDKVPVIGPKINAELGKLFPSTKDGRSHAKITSKVAEAINTALDVLRSL